MLRRRAHAPPARRGHSHSGTPPARHRTLGSPRGLVVAISPPLLPAFAFVRGVDFVVDFVGRVGRRVRMLSIGTAGVSLPPSLLCALGFSLPQISACRLFRSDRVVVVCMSQGGGVYRRVEQMLPLAVRLRYDFVSGRATLRCPKGLPPDGEMWQWTSVHPLQGDESGASSLTLKSSISQISPYGRWVGDRRPATILLR